MEQCLFCLKPCSQLPLLPLGGIPGGSDCAMLENRLFEHFVLRRLLDLPWMWCESTLRKHYSQDDFKLRICKKCVERVHDAWEIHRQIVRLEKGMRQAKEALKSTMLESIRKLRRSKREESWENEVRNLLFPDEMAAPRRPSFIVKAKSKENGEILIAQDFNEDDFLWPDEDDFTGEQHYDSGGEDVGKIDGSSKRRKLTKRRRKAVVKSSLLRRTNIIRKRKRQYLKRDVNYYLKLPTFHKCHLCPAKFKQAEVLRNHLEFHEESKMSGFECQKCSYPARTSQELEVHTFHEHDSEIKNYKRPFACGKCEFTSEIWKVLKDHVDKSHQGVPDDELGTDIQLKCGLCFKQYENSNVLINHQKKMHPELFGAPQEPIQCDQCTMILPSRIHFQYHLKAVHKRLNSHVCDVCGKGFSQQRRLERHKIMHEGKRDFVCHLCGCTYSYKSSLSGHYRKFHPEHEVNPNLNAEVKPSLIESQLAQVKEQEFMCKYCDMKFPFKVMMIRHMNTHKKTIGVKCEVCSKYYINMQGLKQHMKLYHSATNQETQCPYCFKMFPNPHSMHTHSVKHCKMKKMNDVKMDAIIASQELKPMSQITLNPKSESDQPHSLQDEAVPFLQEVQIPIS